MELRMDPHVSGILLKKDCSFGSFAIEYVHISQDGPSTLEMSVQNVNIE